MTAHVQDLEVHLPNRPGMLAELGEALGNSGVSLEGGGVFTHDERAVAHYLVDDGAAALAAVQAAGLGPGLVRDVAMTRLDQGKRGQLGALARMLGNAGVNVLIQYSDHVGNLVLVVSDEHVAVCYDVIERWEQGRQERAVGSAATGDATQGPLATSPHT